MVDVLVLGVDDERVLRKLNFEFLAVSPSGFDDGKVHVRSIYVKVTVQVILNWLSCTSKFMRQVKVNLGMNLLVLVVKLILFEFLISLQFLEMLVSI